MPETQLATKRKDIRDFINGYKSQFAMALPALLTPDRFVRIALTCINKNPKLATCTQDSLLACLLDCAALGIEPDGRRAHLIPYGDKCTLIVDYKGIAELVRRSGEISTLHCGIVYPDDTFDYAFGTGQFLKHKPSIASRDKDVKPLCVYSYVKLKDGEEDFDVMSIDDVERIRKRSRASSNGPWVTDFDEMAKKTVFRRHSKWLPLSPELREKIEKDDDALTEQERFAAAKPVAGIEFGDALPPEVPPADTSNAGHTEEEKKARGRPPKKPTLVEKPLAPALATPLQGLRNLMATQQIEESALLVYLFGQNMVEQGDKLSTLSEAKLQTVIDNFVDIATAMQKEVE